MWDKNGDAIPEFKYGTQFMLSLEDWPPQLILTVDQYKDRLRECDGICQLCHTWSFGIAEPMGACIHCPTCSNPTVVGIKKAIEINLVRIAWANA